MDEELFRTYQEKEGWSDADEESAEGDRTSLFFGTFRNLSVEFFDSTRVIV